MSVIHLQNPAILKVPFFQEFLQKALEKSPWGWDERMLPEIERHIQDPSTGVLLAMEHSTPVGISLVLLPTSPLDRMPQVAYLYSEKATKELIKATVDFIKDKGYNRFQALNYTGNSDKAWMKVMATPGWDITPKATLMEYTVNG